MEYNLKDAHERLTEFYNQWLLTKNDRAKSNIEDSVTRLINNRQYIPDDIYIEAINGMASGLCQPGFFEDDLRRLISIVETKLNIG